MSGYLHKGNVEFVRDIGKGSERSRYGVYEISTLPSVSRFHFSGKVDHACIRERWQQALARWEQLRSIVKEVDGKQLLVVLKDVPFQVEAKSTASCSTPLFEHERSPFALDTGPLCKVSIIESSDGFDLILSAADGLLTLSEAASIAYWIATGELRSLQSARRRRDGELNWSQLPRLTSQTASVYSRCFLFNADLAKNSLLIARALNCSVGDIVAAGWAMLHSIYGDTDRSQVLVASSESANAFDVLDLSFSAKVSLVQVIQQLRTQGARYAYQSTETEDPEAILWIHGDGRGVDCADIWVSETKSDFDIHLYSSSEGGKLLVKSLYDEVFVERIVEHLFSILEYCVNAPEGVDWRNNVLTGEERNTLEGNCPKERPEFEAYFHAIDDMVQKCPNKTAIRAGVRSLTYSDFDALVVAQLEQLIAENVGSGDIVAILAERSPEFIAAIVAANKLGAAYLPLDPLGAIARNIRILGIAEPKLVLVSDSSKPSVAEVTAELPELAVATFRPPADGASGLSTSLQTEEIKSNQAANVFFTSGTTGDPKGIVLHHEGVWNHLLTKIDVCNIRQESIVAQNAAQTFDISHWQMIAPLMVGACTVIYPTEVAENPEIFLPLLNADHVTVLESVPTYIREITRMQTNTSTKLTSLSVLVSNAEALLPADCQNWLQAYPNIPIVNTYGITECSDDFTHRRFEQAPTETNQYLSVGRPAPGTSVLVVGRNGTLQPIGCPGELHIAGVCVGQGYIADSARTKSRFLSNPFPYHSSYKLYRTGDSGYLLENGELVVIGRYDDQLKINGYRVEIGEIEAVISSLNIFKFFHILPEKTLDGSSLLECYYVPLQDEMSNSDHVSEIRAELSAHLPSYMIPAVFHQVQSIPVTKHGKVDRKSLRQIGQAQDDPPNQKPETALQIALHKLWTELLEHDGFGIDDDFFRLGGNSIRTIQMRYRLQQTYKSQISLADLFESRTIRKLAEIIEATGTLDSALSPVVPVDRKQPIHLSPLQRGLWFLQQIDKGNCAYNMVEALVFRENLSKEKLSAAVKELLMQHPVLAANIVTGPDGDPVFQASSSKTAPIEFIQGGEYNKNYIRALLDAELKEPMSLDRDPLFRMKLIKFDQASDVILITMHHIIADERSWQVIKRDLVKLYEKSTVGDEAASQTQAIDYLDFAVWHNKWLQSEEATQKISKWRERLEDTELWLELPRSGSTKAATRSSSNSFTVVLPQRLIKKLNELCQAQNATGFVGGLALYTAFLSRLSGRNNFCIATTISCRPFVDMPDNVGLMAKLVPVPYRLSNIDNLYDVIDKLRDAFHSVAEDALVPLQQIVASVQSSRSEQRKDTFSNAYFQQESDEATDLPIKAIEQVEPDIVDSRFGLMLTAREEKDGLKLCFTFDPDVFDEKTVRGWSEMYLELATKLVTDPAASLVEVDLKDETVQSRVVKGERLVKTEKLLPDFVLEHATRAPNSVAVSCDDRSLTYRELTTLAGGIAEKLLASRHTQDTEPAKSPTPIIVCMDTTVELAVALLAVALSGRPFLPVDPGLPRRRIQEICIDSGADLAIVNAHAVADFTDLVPELLTIDLQDRNASPVFTKVPEGGSAYVIYTSGSSGVPKGVEVGHQELSNMLQGVVERIGEPATRRVASFTSIGFDIFQLEFWLPLMTGGVCHLCPRSILERSEDLLNFVGQVKPTLIQATPSAWTLMFPWLKEKLAETIVLVGGESLPETLANQLERSALSVFNCYGPTEATIWVSMTELAPNTPVHIGSALPNVDLLVVGENGLGVPNGATGELCIVSDSLAKGYLNRAAETAEAFVKQPSPGGEPWASRMYRTGDIVRRERHGQITFLGRRDGQIKIRGHRVELSEIEKSVERSAAVRQAVVIRNPNIEKDVVLTAFVCPKVSQGELDKIRKDLADHLPNHMVPQQWLSLDVMPTTTSGKTDRQSLTSLAPFQPGASQVANPTTPFETAILKEVRSLIGIDTIGIHDDLFQAGYNSITVVSLARNLSKMLGLNVSVRSVYSAATVAALSQSLKAETPDTRHQASIIPLNAIEKAEEPHPLVLIHPQGGGISCYRDFANCLDGQVAIYGIQAIGFGDPAQSPLSTIKEIAARYADDIAAYFPTEREINLAGWSFGGALAVEVCRRLQERGVRVGFLGLFDATPFKELSKVKPPVCSTAVKQWFANVYLEDDVELAPDDLNLKLLQGLQEKGVVSKGDEGQLQLDHLVDFMRHNMEVARTFSFQGKVDIDLWLFNVSQLPPVEKRELVRPAEWEKFTTAQVHTIRASGHHQSMFELEYCNNLANSVLNCLKSYRQSNSSQDIQKFSSELEFQS